MKELKLFDWEGWIEVDPFLSTIGLVLLVALAVIYFVSRLRSVGGGKS